MNSTIHSVAGARELSIDDATLDEDCIGISAGHGQLAAMRSWAHLALVPGGSTLVMAGVASSPDLVVIAKGALPAFAADSFSSRAMMLSIGLYSKQNEQLLSGPGLVLRRGQLVPIAAFSVVEDAAERGTDSATHLYHPHDFASAPLALKQISSNRIDTAPSRQLAWLINACVVRAALQMEAFATSAPELSPGKWMRFTSRTGNERVLIASDTSPLSLHKVVRFDIQGKWQVRLTLAAKQVAEEFAAELSVAGVPEMLASSIREEALECITRSSAFISLRNSSAAFVDIHGIAQTCASFAGELDRVAIRNAFRHGMTGLTWGNYEAHRNSHWKELIDDAAGCGSLAYAQYPVSLLAGLIEASAGNKVSSFSFEASVVHKSVEIEACFAGYFARALAASLDQPARNALMDVSPRYLSGIICSPSQGLSLAQKFLSDHLNPSQDVERTAEAAGRRLGEALNFIMDASSTKVSLPWARVLTSAPAYHLMLGSLPTSDAVKGLSSLVAYANAMRSKGKTSDEVVYSLPHASQLIAAPHGHEAISLAGLMKVNEPKRLASAKRSALLLVRDFIASMESEQLVLATKAGTAPAAWHVLLAALKNNHNVPNLASGFRVGIHHPCRRGGLWTVAHVVASTGDASLLADFGRAKQTSEDERAFSVYGKAPTGGLGGAGSVVTADGTKALTFRISMPAERCFMPISEAPVNGVPSTDLGLIDISGCGVNRAHMNKRPSPTQQLLRHSLAKEKAAEMNAMVDGLKAAIGKQPIQAACIFPAVAQYMLEGGVLPRSSFVSGLSGLPCLPSVPPSKTMKLARACLGSDNWRGMTVLCRTVTNPEVKTATGVGILDVAAESADVRLAQGALIGLKSNVGLAKGLLATIVQASAGKLIERHPSLLSLVIDLGAKPTPELLSAWNAVHPERKDPEMQAQLDRACMDHAISTSTAKSAADRASTTRMSSSAARRRARLV